MHQTSRKHASPERMQRSRVALLTNTYKDQVTIRVRVGLGLGLGLGLATSDRDLNPNPNPNPNPNQYHYWEAVDLTRKLLLTSVG